MARRGDGVFLRNGNFYIQYKNAAGKWIKEKTSARNLNEARTLRTSKMFQAEKIKALGFTPPTEKTFEQVAEEYLAEQGRKLTPDILLRVSGIFRLYLSPFFAGPLKDVKRGKVDDYLTRRHKDKAAAATIVKELQVLKGLFRFAVHRDYLPLNPAAEVKGPKIKESEQAFITKPELPLLLASCPAWLHPIVLFAIATGFRRKNILMLTWKDVDLKRRVATLRETKNGDTQRMPLTDGAIAVLSVVGGDRKGNIFSVVGSPQNVSVCLRRAAKKAGLAGIHFHSLRHTFGSWSTMAGTPQPVVQRLMGHKTPRMTARYSHLSPEYMQSEVSKLDAVFSPALLLNSGDNGGTKN